jgi:hypothetical protein
MPKWIAAKSAAGCELERPWNSREKPRFFLLAGDDFRWRPHSALRGKRTESVHPLPRL